MKDMVEVVVKVYGESKYSRNAKKIAEVKYRITDFYIVSGSEVDGVDEYFYDENDEYLVIVHEDGEKSTFRNSYVDMFRI